MKENHILPDKDGVSYIDYAHFGRQYFGSDKQPYVMRRYETGDWFLVGLLPKVKLWSGRNVMFVSSEEDKSLYDSFVRRGIWLPVST